MGGRWVHVQWVRPPSVMSVCLFDDRMVCWYVCGLGDIIGALSHPPNVWSPFTFGGPPSN